MRSEVIPAVDVLGDEAVRLRQGDFGELVLRGRDPADLARTFAAEGAAWIHLVDLDGARSGSTRPELVRRVAAAAAPARIQASGGIRSIEDAKVMLEAGSQRVVIGTAAFAAADALALFTEALGDRLVVALDVRDDIVATNGWTTAGSSLDEALERCRAAAVPRVLSTAIARDGTATGPDVDLVARVAASGLPVIAAGGVRDDADVDALLAVGAEAVIAGRALLEGTLL
jgi:phosphoribosylformimino-5-aminoimidazole carboxamide ribotide isomerase